MTASALATLMAVGFVVGLIFQFLMVRLHIEPEQAPLKYVGMGVIGVAGALVAIPGFLLLHDNRGTLGPESLDLISPILGAISLVAVFYAKWIELADKELRLRILVGLAAAATLLMLMLLLA